MRCQALLRPCLLLCVVPWAGAARGVHVRVQDERGSQWRVQAVSVTPSSFQSRLPLPEKWRGLRDDELSRESGIPGGVFVHISGFIGGNHTKEGALAMAKAALQGACHS